MSNQLFPYEMACRRTGRSRRGGRGGSQANPRAAGTLGEVLDPANLNAVLEELRRNNGQAPGVDHIRFPDLSGGEWFQLFRDLAADVTAGMYRRQPTRALEIPKRTGGVRTLNLPTVADRTLSKAVAVVLERYAELVFLPSSYGFRQDLSRLDLLADLAVECETNDRWVITADDVRKAFDMVDITRAVTALERLGADPDLVALAGVILRGHHTKEVGIAQGDPLSPLMLNILLHHVLDDPMSVTRDGHTPVPYQRYADNVLVVTETAAEGGVERERMRTLLAEAGLELKGDPGVPRALQHGDHLDLLGSRLTCHQGRLRFHIPNKAWDDLQSKLVATHNTPDPRLSADATVRGWVTGHAPTFGTTTDEEIRNRLHNLLRTTGHKEAIGRRGMIKLMEKARTHWNERVRRRTGLSRNGE